MSEAPVCVETLLDQYIPLIGESEVRELRILAQRLGPVRLTMINSTRVGGGVAEILCRLIPLFEDLGLHATWQVIRGNEPFFQMTKKVHNALHGMPEELSPRDREVYVSTSKENAANLDFDYDFVFIHDPQPAALIKYARNSQATWIWRCHIDISHPVSSVWKFLEPTLKKYHCAIVSSPAFAQTKLGIRQFLFYPAIDPFSDKNKELHGRDINIILKSLGIPRDKPIVLQVSRYDRLKDPIGVIRAFRLAQRHVPCRLVLAGGAADDDPEGAEVLSEVRAEAGDDPDIHILVLPSDANIEINALQRAATVVLQKSLREGFGLTVTEALLKRKAVIGGAVGGIPNQIRHEVNGVLVHSVAGCANEIRRLLTDKSLRDRFGKYGRATVIQEFLTTRVLRSYLLLMYMLRQGMH
jgi:trehalose synthase